MTQPRNFFTTLSLLILLCLGLNSCGESTSSSRPAPPASPGKGLLGTAVSANPAPSQTELVGFADSDSYINQCALPRSGIDPATGKAFVDKPGSLQLEKLWLRSVSHETYLWSDEIVDINFNNLSLLDYFMELRTKAKTTSGKEKDHFHFYQKSADEYQQFVLGKDIGYGIRWKDFDGDYTVIYTQPGSPAALAGIRRGMILRGVDHVALNSSTVDSVNNVLYNAAENSTHTIELFDLTINTTTSFSVTAREVQEQPVFPLTTLTGLKGEKVGYIGFHTFNGPSEKALVEAVQTLENNQVSELIVDLRYNGGGYITVASELAYMIAGKQKTQNKVFSHTLYNPAIEAAIAAGHKSTDEMFATQTKKISPNLTEGQPLPTLNLQRVYVLTGANTCSASELLINALRGIDLPVIQIGETTCGKPYGFFDLHNCGYKYYTINFQTQNAKGFGNYGDGMSARNDGINQGSPAGCVVSDDPTHELGDVNEKRIAAALEHIANGNCSDNIKPIIRGLMPSGIAAPIYHLGAREEPVWQTNMIKDRPSY